MGELHQTFSAVRLGAFERKSHASGPDELRQASESAGNTEENSVVAHFSHTEVLEKDTGVGINVRPWVLGFSLFEKDVRSDLVEVRNEFEHWIIGEVLEGEFTLASVARISLTKDSVSVSGNDLKSFDIVRDL